MNAPLTSSPPALWEPPSAFDAFPPGLVDKLAAVKRRLAHIGAKHARAKLASSLSPEDMLLTDIILYGLPHLRERLPVFTLLTGHLPAETLDLLERANAHYRTQIETFTPDAEAVDAFVAEHGERVFYDSVEQRKRCCFLRKVEPLNRALRSADAWITGQRREQSATRRYLPLNEHDAERDIPKYNPLADWTEAEVWACIRHRGIPVNALHARGYPSIGCEPCTCPVRAGQDPRTGRWWWEDRDSKECGLHPVVS